MTWSNWWLFFVTELVLSLTPGPAVLFVIASALRGRLPSSVPATIGILSANAFYFALSATGIGAILAASYQFFVAVKYLGAAYLVILGLRSLFSRESKFQPADPATPASRSTMRQSGMNGFLLQIANPKAIIFFVAIVPQFVDPRRPIGWQIVILGLTSIIPEFFVLLAYGALASQASHLMHEPKYASWTNRISGALLILAGTGIAAIKRN